MRRLLLNLLVSITPAAATCLLVFLFFRCTPTDYIPFWNDEVDYWHQILTFTRFGFAGGYYSIEELIAPASFSHFGTHGPFFPVIYGLIGKIAGWTEASATLFNLALFTIAGILFLQLIKPGAKQLLMTALMLLTFWPLLLYLPTTMQEPLHMSLALILAGLFYRLIDKRQESNYTFMITAIVLVLAALLRASWGILFIPLLLAGTARRSFTTTVNTLAAGVICLTLSLLTFTFLAAPYPDNFVNNLLAVIKTRPAAGLNLFYDHICINLQHFFSWKSDETLEIVLRYQLLVALIGTVGIRFIDSKNQRSRQEVMVHCCNILLILLLVISLYDIGDWRSYRIFAPHLLFSMALFIACNRATVIYILIALSFAFVQNFAKLYPDFHRGHYTGDKSAAAAFGAAYGSELRFRQDASPWGNSLLIGIEDCQPFLAGLPAGIGINCVLDWNRISYPLKSAYVIIPPEVYRHIAGKVRLQPVKSGSFGALFINLDSPPNKVRLI